MNQGTEVVVIQSNGAPMMTQEGDPSILLYQGMVGAYLECIRTEDGEPLLISSAVAYLVMPVTDAMRAEFAEAKAKRTTDAKAIKIVRGAPLKH